MTTTHEYVPRPGIVTAKDLSGSKNPTTALEIPLTWLNVPIPKSPTHAPKNAKILASHFQFFHIPFSI